MNLLEITSLQMQLVKMISLGWAPIQCDWCLFFNLGEFGHKHMYTGECHKHEDSHLQTKERSLNHILPHTEWTNTPTLILDLFSLQNCWITNCLYLSHQFVVLCYSIPSMAILTPLFLTLHMHSFRKSSWLLLQNLSRIWPLLTISIVTTQIQVIIQSIISCLDY